MGMIDHHTVAWTRDSTTMQYRRGRQYSVRHAAMRLKEILREAKKVKRPRRVSVIAERSQLKFNREKNDEMIMKFLLISIN